jgi:type IV pilus assembly protein PilA
MTRADEQPVKRHANNREQGFSLIELLVVILIIGVLAAIAIPAFISQKGKATDASGKEMARTAAEAAETYQTDHGGQYNGISPSVLHEYEATIQTSEGGKNAYLSVAEEIESGKGYKVTAVAPTTNDTFTITRSGNGQISRTCAAVASGKNGCPSSASW